MTVTAFTNSTGLGPLPRLLEAAGGSRMLTRVFQSENLPLSLASGEANWIPLRSLLGLFERSAAMLGDDLIGLRVGQAMQPEDFGLWARYGMSGATLRDKILRSNRGLRFHQTGGELALDVRGEIAVWRYSMADPATYGRRHHAEHILWPMLTALRRHTSAKWDPIRIECSYERPPCWRKLEVAFGPPLFFGKAANAIVFKRHLLEDATTHVMPLEMQVTCGDILRMARRRPPTTILEATRAVVRTRIAEPLTDIEGTARLLGMSPRTLQRNLGEENFTFREVLEQVRMERALELLQDTTVSITEIAFSLGYDDATSFSRAFRRWAGYSPNHVRQVPPSSAK